MQQRKEGMVVETVKTGNDCLGLNPGSVYLLVL